MRAVLALFWRCKQCGTDNGLNGVCRECGEPR